MADTGGGGVLFVDAGEKIKEEVTVAWHSADATRLPREPENALDLMSTTQQLLLYTPSARATGDSRSFHSRSSGLSFSRCHYNASISRLFSSLLTHPSQISVHRPLSAPLSIYALELNPARHSVTHAVAASTAVYSTPFHFSPTQPSPALSSSVHPHQPLSASQSRCSCRVTMSLHDSSSSSSQELPAPYSTITASKPRVPFPTSHGLSEDPVCGLLDSCSLFLS